jgi:hypothetical protein
MPDTLSREEIAAIARHAEHGITQDAANVRALLAHIDALTAAVGDIEPKLGHEGIVWVPYDAVLAIINGEPHDA